jgi:DNA-binding CsgD family transcriptional regulator
LDLTQANIDKTVETISEIISLAPLGLADWSDITVAMTDLFPGSFSGLINYDVVNDAMPFLEVDGVEQSFLRFYMDYYHTINPYEKYWRGHEDGLVWISDYVLPISQLQNDEFYNDWMAKLGEFDSAIGVKLNPTAENEVRFNLQFATKDFAAYEAPAMYIMRQVRAPLYRAITIAQHLTESQSKLAGASALVDRKDKAAFIVDVSAYLKDCNSVFERYLEMKTLFNQDNGQLSLLNYRYDGKFKQLVRQIALFASAQTSKMVVRDEGGDWVLSCSRLPSPLNSGPLIPQPLVLVTVTRLGQAKNILDLKEFSSAYHLTKAEERLCQMLTAGHSLSEAASRCSITYETARSRIKDIFSKTRTSRQADLMLLLERYRSG